jgi:hypothetical protein
MPGISALPATQSASRVAVGGVCQKIAISGTSAQSAAIAGHLVHVTPTVDCYVREAANPTASATGVDHFLVANATQSFAVTRGNKLAFITEGAAGTVRIAEVGL